MPSSPSRANSAFVSRCIAARFSSGPRLCSWPRNTFLRDRQVRDQVELLVDGGDAAGDRRVRIPDRQRLAFEPNLAGSRLNQPGNALDQRRLAGTILANEAMHLTAGHRQVDAAQGTHARIVLDQPTNLQQRAGSVAHPLLRYPLGLSTLLAACAHRSWD